MNSCKALMLCYTVQSGKPVEYEEITSIFIFLSEAFYEIGSCSPGQNTSSFLSFFLFFFVFVCFPFEEKGRLLKFNHYLKSLFPTNTLGLISVTNR